MKSVSEITVLLLIYFGLALAINFFAYNFDLAEFRSTEITHAIHKRIEELLESL